MRSIKLISIIVFLLSSTTSMAQDGVISSMRGDGKIYVVIAVMLVIMLGIFSYLFILDKKLNRIENEVKEK